MNEKEGAEISIYKQLEFTCEWFPECLSKISFLIKPKDNSSKSPNNGDDVVVIDQSNCYYELISLKSVHSHSPNDEYNDDFNWWEKY